MCGLISKINEWAGNKCNEFMTKAVSDTIHKFLAKHLATATLCGYGGKLATLISGGEDTGVQINCKEGKTQETNPYEGLSDEEVIKEGIKDYLALVEEWQKANRWRQMMG